MDNYIIMLECRGVNDNELIQCKKRLQKTKQQSAYVPQLDVPEDEILELQDMLDSSFLDDDKDKSMLGGSKLHIEIPQSNKEQPTSHSTLNPDYDKSQNHSGEKERDPMVKLVEEQEQSVHEEELVDQNGDYIIFSTANDDNIHLSNNQ